jgi:hypothetical protein
MSHNPFMPLPPGPTTAPGQVLNDAVARVQAELLRKDPMTVSQDGWDALEDATAEHLGSVGVLATQIARREKYSQVEKEHVEEAHARMGARPRATLSVFITSTLGGLFAGVGGGTLGNIYTDSPLPTASDPALITSLILSAIGLALVITSIAITIASRRR